MRVIAGTHGGRRLRAPRGRDVRPTADRVREALFSSLGDRIPGACVVDLYAGSGALGIEALSRGAAHVTFVERSPAVAAVLQANLRDLGLDAPVLVRSVAAFARDHRPPPVVDVVLADPPYADDLTEFIAALDTLRRAGGLRTGAAVVVERSRRADDELPGWLEPQRRRAYGDTVLVQASLRVDVDGQDGREDDGPFPGHVTGVQP